MLPDRYDYIITGTGCAGLSLAMHLMANKQLQHKRILLIDETTKDQNDRTWCYWEKEAGFFDPIVHSQWDHIWFYGNNFSKALSITPYRYKMIRGIDFYRYCLEALEKNQNVHFLRAKVDAVFSEETTGVIAGGKTFTADYVFNSILFKKPHMRQKEIWLLQHFKGWMVETNKPAFNPDEATLMDFRTSQKRGTAFCYVLPYSSTKALVEYTLFTPSLLKDEEYDAALKEYCADILKLYDYRITENEFGVIPMTNYRFPRGEKNVINIGTAGGQTKGSSGYTFYFIQQHCKKMVERLSTGLHPYLQTTPGRFQFYDSVLLDVLEQNRMPGKEIFTTMFRKNKPRHVLSFLNNASHIGTEARIIATLPTLPFLKAAVRQVL